MGSQFDHTPHGSIVIENANYYVDHQDESLEVRRESDKTESRNNIFGNLETGNVDVSINKKLSGVYANEATIAHSAKGTQAHYKQRNKPVNTQEIESLVYNENK